MATSTIHEAKTNLSRLIERAEKGEEIVIARGKTPVVKLVAIRRPASGQREPGMFKGEFEVGDAFFDPLPDDELAAWDQ